MTTAAGRFAAHPKAEYRRRRAAVLDKLRNPPEGTPALSEFAPALAGWHLDRAWGDSAKIDTAEGKGGSDFATGFLHSLEPPEAAAAAVRDFLFRGIDRKQFDPVNNAAGGVMFGGKPQSDYFREWSLWTIREEIRDGFPPSAVIASHAKEIAEFAAAGDTVYFAGLGDIVRKYTKAKPRGLEGWILRAWIPLALWTLPADPAEAHTLCKRAAAALGIDMPPENEAGWNQFCLAWKMARTRRK